MADPSFRQAVREETRCYIQEQQAISRTVALFQRPINVQTELDDLFRIEFPLRPTSNHFRDFYAATLERYQTIANMSVPGVLYDGTQVEIPVTAPSFIAEQTYHTIVIRLDNGATLEILIDESNNYVVGFTVYHNEEDRNNAPWFVFKKVNLPGFFGTRIPINYELNYRSLKEILFGDGVVENLVDFLFTFEAAPHQQSTTQGRLNCETLFWLFGEGPRFRVVQKWTKDNATNAWPQHPPNLMCQAINDYSKLCSCSLHLRQYNVEIPFLDALSDDEKEFSPFALTQSEAFETWKFYEAKYKDTDMVFRRGDGKITLESLVGGELLRLNYDYKYCMRILMRQAGYAGKWFNRLK